MSRCGKGYCICSGATYIEGFVDGLGVGYALGYTQGYRTGYRAGQLQCDPVTKRAREAAALDARAIEACKRLDEIKRSCELEENRKLREYASACERRVRY